MIGIKTCTFAAVHMTVAFGVAFALTGDWRVGGALALVEPAVNTLAFYAHERSWMRWSRAARPAQRRMLTGPTNTVDGSACPTRLTRAAFTPVR